MERTHTHTNKQTHTHTTHTSTPILTRHTHTRIHTHQRRGEDKNNGKDAVDATPKEVVNCPGRFFQQSAHYQIDCIKR